MVAGSNDVNCLGADPLSQSSTIDTENVEDDCVAPVGDLDYF